MEKPKGGGWGVASLTNNPHRMLMLIVTAILTAKGADASGILRTY